MFIFYNRKGSRWPMGVVPRLLRPGGTGGSIDVLRGVCIPDGVDVPLRLRLCMGGKKILALIRTSKIYIKHDITNI